MLIIEKLKKTEFLFAFSLSLLLIILAIIYRKNSVGDSGFVFLSFLVNALIAFCGLVISVNAHPYSFDMIFWLFNLFFFGVAPVLQYELNAYSWHLNPTDTEILIINLLITIWFLFYWAGKFIGYLICPLIGKWKKHWKNQVFSAYRINPIALTSLIFLSALIIAYFIKQIGFANILLRFSNNDDTFQGSLRLLLFHVLHNALLFTALFHILHARRRGFTVVTAIAFVFFLFGCFPTGLPRNMTASFYGGLLVIFYEIYGGSVRGNTERKRWITWAILGGLVILFPILGIFRRADWQSKITSFRFVLTLIQENYVNPNYDAHQMFISIFRWIRRDGFRMGRQFLGAALFFVPRTFWLSKPYGTGQEAFTALRQGTSTNVSAPLVAEGYANFGVFGVIAFAMITGIAVYVIDRAYWNQRNPLSEIRVLYPFAMLMFFFICRGDMMSSWAYTIAQIVTGHVIYRFAVRKRTLYLKPSFGVVLKGREQQS